MSVPFDPYYKWLAIPPREQPPNHYRLLGVPLFETDADVIASAADRQMAHVKSHATGTHVELSQRILNELAGAKLCLLNGGEKADYDEQLRLKSWSGQDQTITDPSGDTPVEWKDLDPFGEVDPFSFQDEKKDSDAFPSIEPLTANPRPVWWKKQRFRQQTHLKWIGLSALVLLGLLVVWTGIRFAFRQVSQLVRASLPAAQTLYGPSETRIPVAAGLAADAGRPGGHVFHGGYIVDDEAALPEPVTSSLGRIPGAVDLPPIEQTTPIELCRWNPPDNSTWHLELLDAPLPENRAERFYLQRKPSRTSAASWLVYLASSGGEPTSSPGLSDTHRRIATFVQRGVALEFHWLEGAAESSAGQLRNVVLRLSCEKETRQLRLRTPQVVSALPVDLAVTSQVRIVEIGDFPKEEGLRLEISRIEYFPAAYTIQPSDGLVGLGESAYLTFRKTPSVQLELVAVRTSDGVDISLNKTYRMPDGKKQKLTIQGVHLQQETCDRRLTESQRELTIRKRQLDQFQRKLKLTMQRPTPGGPNAAMARSNKRKTVKKLKSDIWENERIVRDVKKKVVPSLKADREALAAVEKLISSFNRDALIDVRVFFLVGDQEVDLVLAGDAPH